MARKEFNLRDKLYIAATPDEDGDVMMSARSSTVFMTRKEMREMRDHLDSLLADEPQGVHVGSKVRVINTSHDDLRGKIGTVDFIFDSGNLQVGLGNEIIVVGPDWVEVVK